MSRSDYKNIYEGYLDNTGYNNRNIRERYGGCGSEPTPPPQQITENYGAYDKTINATYLNLPDCGTLGAVKENWTTCANGNQIIKYNFIPGKKSDGKKYNFSEEGKLCKIPFSAVYYIKN
jgi:hypothetical protein